MAGYFRLIPYYGILPLHNGKTLFSYVLVYAEPEQSLH